MAVVNTFNTRFNTVVSGAARFCFRTKSLYNENFQQQKNSNNIFSDFYADVAALAYHSR
jgi:hypothetical protein